MNKLTSGILLSLAMVAVMADDYYGPDLDWYESESGGIKVYVGDVEGLEVDYGMGYQYQDLEIQGRQYSGYEVESGGLGVNYLDGRGIDYYDY